MAYRAQGCLCSCTERSRCHVPQALAASLLGAPILPLTGAPLFQMGAPRPIKSVSYTHLTLPTICSV
eukprot:3705288-Rhodomonas_salina.3